MTKHTILFHIACRNVCQMSPELETKVYDLIEDWCNGDGLYEGASKEVILDAYFHQHKPLPWETEREVTWVDLVRDLVDSLN